MATTEGITNITHFRQNSDNSFDAKVMARPLPGECAKDIITNCNGNDDIDELYEGNDFIENSIVYELILENDFNNEV